MNTLKHKLFKNTCFLLLLVGSMLVLSCKNDIEEVRQITHDTKFPSLKIIDLHTAITDSGMLRMIVDAKVMQKFDLGEKEDAYDEYPEGIHVEFYQDGELSSRIKAKYAIYYPHKDLWEARRNVVAENLQKEEKLETELLFWDVKDERIYSDQFVRFTTESDSYYGTGFESDQSFENVEILDLQGDFSIKDDETTETK